MSQESALRTKSRAFRWALWLIVGSFVPVGLAFAGVLSVAAAYWAGLLLALGAIAAMVVYFVAHQESRR
jgi:hypothetical protein